MIRRSVSFENILAYKLLATLFFCTGFLTSLNGVLIVYFKETYQLSYFVANVIPLVFFLAYFILSLPFGYLAHHVNYRATLIVGGFLGVVGCLFFILAMQLNSIGFLLLGLFLIASFITAIEVAANPLVDSMGPPLLAAQRLTLVHFLDSTGTVIGPQIAAFIFLMHSKVFTLDLKASIFYAILAVIFLILMMCIYRNISKHKEGVPFLPLDTNLWHRKNFTLGIVAIFVYVGCEVSIANFFISFALQSGISTLTKAQAALGLSCYWAGQMFGRLLGIPVLNRLRAEILLMVCGFAAMGLILNAMYWQNIYSLVLLILVGLANAIMFPTIFALAVENLGPAKTKASGIIHMGIVGGAVISIAQGKLADYIGVIYSYLLPAALYGFIIFYSLQCLLLKKLEDKP